MNLFSYKTFLEVITIIITNLTSGWFGALLITTGFINGITFDKYLKSLMLNLQYGILGLIVSLLLTERIKSL
ncbi:MAG: hypothetical protein UY19_C0002G0003 [Candidatus Wolfebacteria bacterium GW2011_GWA2_47_9b]|uniref:Uncharacterized protein n=1 Tax=Candidatus Wolfebacteria bacterium GW2011_GWA2_47_9b TaxID=1619005 RepID=A0A0G1X7T2_9BACT|nr:MAG: hypothetical protein UY19_C0002G0003 [Candidatus Wolfebacteria bacterium GW2011_GWA2_47_9b]